MLDEGLFIAGFIRQGCFGYEVSQTHLQPVMMRICLDQLISPTDGWRFEPIEKQNLYSLSKEGCLGGLAKKRHARPKIRAIKPIENGSE